MSDGLDKKIFGNKKFSHLLKEIYDNQKKRETQVNSLIQDLKPLIGEIGDATLVVPLIKDYLDIGVKNDDHLIKMATLIQRLVSSNNQAGGGGDGITQAEKDQILKDIEGMNSNIKDKDSDN